MSSRLENPDSVRRPIFPVSAEARIFEEWSETLGVLRTVRAVPRAEYARRAREPSGPLFVPERPRVGEIPAILARASRAWPADSRARASLESLASALDEAMSELAVRIALSSRPRALKRAAGRYRRLAAALGLPAPRGTSRQTELRWPAERAEADEVTVRLLDDRIARACLEAFYETFLSRARSLLVSGALAFTRRDSDALRVREPPGAGSMFRCERHELSVRPVRLADLFALPPSHIVAPADPERFLRALVLEIAAYPWEAESDGANAGVEYILREKRAGCVGKSLLLHAFLDHVGIGHSALDMFDHSALVTAVPGCRLYLDPTNFVAPVPLPMRPAAIGAFGYEALPVAELPPGMRAVRAVAPSAGIVAQLLANIAVEYARQREYRDARALLDSARRLVPGSAALLGLSGRVARLAWDRAAARGFLELAVERCPQDFRSSRELAAMLLSDGRYGRAKTLYSGVAAREGAPAAAWYEYGVACAYDRDDDRALAAFDRVLADDPDNARALDLRFRILRTVALERGGAFQRRAGYRESAEAALRDW